MKKESIEGVSHKRRGQPLTYDFGVIKRRVSRPPRIEFAGGVHHIMARGDRREEIFRDDRDRWKFLGYLAEGAERYRMPSSNSVAQTIRRTKTHNVQTLKVLKHQISHK